MLFKGKKVGLNLLMLFILVFGFCACQATPETAVVIAKDSTEKAVLEAAKNPEVEIFTYEAPDHVDKRFTVVEGMMDMVIDADVDVPDVAAFPVASIKSAPFTQEFADKVREYFMKDGQLFPYQKMTKSDYDAMIVKAKRGHFENGEYVFDEGDQEWVDKLIEQRKSAPDEDTSTEITDYSIGHKNGLYGRVFIDGRETLHLIIRTDSIYIQTNKTYWEEGQVYYDREDQRSELETCAINMTEEEAVETAEKVLSELGISGLAIKEMHKAYFLDQEKRFGDEVDYGGYTFVFMRPFGGLMPAEIQQISMSEEEKFDCSPPVDMEVLTLAINDRGEVEQFSWCNPVEITGTLTEHVNILPFEDIMARLEEFSKLQYAFMSDYDGDALSLKKVSKISLNINYIPIKNNPNEFMYAPCWYFTYSDSLEHTKEQNEALKKRGADPADMDEEMGEGYIILSAVDGASVSVYSDETFDNMMRWEEFEDEMRR